MEKTITSEYSVIRKNKKTQAVSEVVRVAEVFMSLSAAEQSVVCLSQLWGPKDYMTKT